MYEELCVSETLLKKWGDDNYRNTTSVVLRPTFVSKWGLLRWLLLIPHKWFINVFVTIPLTPFPFLYNYKGLSSLSPFANGGTLEFLVGVPTKVSSNSRSRSLLPDEPSWHLSLSTLGTICLHGFVPLFLPFGESKERWERKTSRKKVRRYPSWVTFWSFVFLILMCQLSSQWRNPVSRPVSPVNPFLLVFMWWEGHI